MYEGEDGYTVKRKRSERNEIHDNVPIIILLYQHIQYSIDQNDKQKNLEFVEPYDS